MQKDKLSLNRISNVDRAVLLFGICNIFQKCIPFILLPILTRYFNTEEYGIYSLYNSWVLIITVFATLNLHLGGFNNGLCKYSLEKMDYTISIIFLSTIITIITFISCYFINYRLNLLILNLPMKYFILMFFQIVFVQGLNCWIAKARYEYLFMPLFFVTGITGLVSFLLPIWGIWKNADIFQIIFCIQLPNMIVGAGCYIYCLVRNKVIINSKYWKAALLFNIPLLPHYISGVILNQMDRIMIERLCGSHEVGLYSVSYNLSTALNLVINSVNAALVPDIYEALKNKKYEKVSAQIDKYRRWLAIAVVLMILIMPEVLIIVASKNYSESIITVSPIVLSCFFVFVYNIFANVEFYYGANVFISVASVIAAISNLILNRIFIPSVGYYAAAYTTAFCYMIYAIAHMVGAKKLCKKNNCNDFIDITKIFFSITMLSVFALVIGLFYEYVIMRYVLFVITIVIIIIISIRRKRNEICRSNTGKI